MSRSNTHKTIFAYQVLLLLAAAIWGLGTVVVKDTVSLIPPAWLVGIRFTSAGVIFCALFLPRLVKIARAGGFPTICVRGWRSGCSSSSRICSTLEG